MADNDLTKMDPKAINTLFCLKVIYSSSTSKDIKYEGYIEEIMANGVRLKAKESCAVGHNIIFKIVKNTKELLNGTGRIDKIEQHEGSVEVICVFNQFSEEDKKRLQAEASGNQQDINNYMDDLS